MTGSNKLQQHKGGTRRERQGREVRRNARSKVREETGETSKIKKEKVTFFSKKWKSAGNNEKGVVKERVKNTGKKKQPQENYCKEKGRPGDTVGSVPLEDTGARNGKKGNTHLKGEHRT